MKTIHLLSKGKKTYCGVQMSHTSAIRSQTTTFEDWSDCKKCLEIRLKRLRDKKTPELAMPSPNTDRYSGEFLQKSFNGRHGIGTGGVLTRDEVWVGANK